MSAHAAPGALSATIRRGAASPRAGRSRPSSSQSSLASRAPRRIETSARAPFSLTPAAHDVFRRTAGPDRQVDRIKKQNDRLDLVQVIATELCKALVQRLADHRHGRLRRPPEPSLLTQRLDVAHRSILGLVTSGSGSPLRSLLCFSPSSRLIPICSHRASITEISEPSCHLRATPGFERGAVR
jgi:hypothetical protein